jgi:hypothetical protein
VRCAIGRLLDGDGDGDLVEICEVGHPWLVESLFWFSARSLGQAPPTPPTRGDQSPYNLPEASRCWLMCVSGGLFGRQCGRVGAGSWDGESGCEFARKWLGGLFEDGGHGVSGGGDAGSAPWACIAKGELEISGTLGALLATQAGLLEDRDSWALVGRMRRVSCSSRRWRGRGLTE